MPFATRTGFDKELQELDDKILKLASMVDQAIEDGMNSLRERDVALAQGVIQGDLVINDLRYDIEQQALLLFATQQPTAGDLRHLIAIIHIAVELERIGDHAEDIATLTERLEDEGDFDSLHKLPKMEKRAREMVQMAVEAFINRDAELARKLIAKDAKLDKHYYKLRNDVLTEMQDDPEYVRRASFLLWAGHDLERIGDRITNIAERVIFMVTGEFIES
ncbi:MAG: phosphate signaling complex protein PhoU [Candidatus Promineifilaceae bacterium]|jgi:phosphate transport system protein